MMRVQHSAIENRRRSRVTSISVSRFKVEFRWQIKKRSLAPPDYPVAAFGPARRGCPRPMGRNPLPKLILSQYANHLALNLDRGRVHHDWGHAGIGWLQTNLVTFPVKPFQSRVIAIYQSHNNVAIVRNLSVLHQDVVSIKDAFFLH